MIARFAAATGDGAVYARFLRNIGWIFSSQAAVAVCGLVAMAAAARSLGAEGVAVVALVEAYMRLVALLVHLEPWQAVIRFGSEALERGDARRLRTLIAWSTAVDLALGCAAGLVALVLAGFVAPLLGLEAHAGLLTLAAIGIAFSLRPTGIALLRLFDRFDLLARLDAGLALARALLMVAAALAGMGPAAFVAITVIFALVEGMLTYLLGRRVMARMLPAGTADPARHALRQNPGLLRVFVNSNLLVMLRQVTQRLDVIILGAVASAQAVGFYHIARRSAEAALRLGRPLSQAIYPELARFAAARETARLGRFLAGTSGLLVLGLVLVLTPVVIWMEPLVVAVFGESFRDASQIVAIQVVASGVLLAGLGISPAALSLDDDMRLVLVRLGVTAVFFALFWPVAMHFGAEGAAAVHLVCNLLWIGAGALLVRAALARRATGPA